MKNIKQRFVIAVGGILAALLLPLEVALADPGKEMGCILREQGSLKFVRGDQLDRQTIMKTINAQRLQGAKVIDPCLTGQVNNIPASVYAKLAEKHPEKFQPLENSNQGIVLPEKAATTGAALGIAPQYLHVGILETLTIPPEFLFVSFFPIAITNESRIYGTFFEYLEFEPSFIFNSYAAIFEQGTVNVLQKSKGFFANRANEGGTIGGFVITDLENFFTQAALFDGNEVQLIPRLPGEISSQVILLNDPGVAMILSLDENFNERLALYKNGEVSPLDFGPDISFTTPSGMNNQGIIVGTTFIDGLGFRGFRFDPRTNLTMLLEPLPTEPDSWAMGINNRGNVLGYSFVGGAIERIGVWNAQGKFHTYFVEGTPEFPTISNRLRFNDNNEILITFVTRPVNERNNSYLIPKPGVRLNLADLVVNAPADLALFPSGINNHGNIFGHAGPFFFFHLDYFLLERIGLGGTK
ncbi:hypothetical protein [Nitrosomonas ureae]|uniref:Uncharacterized protein n=1 Tax=Nitrosomonas ureae TaxID=44577 RepID=A0A1H5USX3_9PROT|nr:hypothetical protein [Nitrosomonas ureae]SEF78195.1 hypothetical protein SAMN05216334_10942 [Nitrosomonas ureae]